MRNVINFEYNQSIHLATQVAQRLSLTSFCDVTQMTTSLFRFTMWKQFIRTTA